MSMTNCINCGAAKDSEEYRCPHCGTLYFDMTALDLDGNTPVACVFKMPRYFGNVDRITMLARPMIESIEQEDPIPSVLWCDDRPYSVIREPSYPKFKLSFDPVMDKNGVIFKLYTKDGR